MKSKFNTSSDSYQTVFLHSLTLQTFSLVSPSLGAAAFLRDLDGAGNLLAHLEKVTWPPSPAGGHLNSFLSSPPSRQLCPSRPASALQDGQKDRGVNVTSRLCQNYCLLQCQDWWGCLCARAFVHRKWQIACCMCRNTLSARARLQLHGSEGRVSSVRMPRGHVRHSKYQPLSFLT